MPNLGYMPDLVAIEIHDVHIIRRRALACRRAGATLTGVRAGEDSVRAHVVALVVSGHRLELVSTVRNESEQSLHPLRVLFHAVHVHERLGLSGKRRIRLAELFASLPALAGLADFEEFAGNLCNR